MLKETAQHVFLEAPGGGGEVAGGGGALGPECPPFGGVVEAGSSGGPFWLPRDSERLWRGSYKGKDWRHLVGGLG